MPDGHRVVTDLPQVKITYIYENPLVKRIVFYIPGILARGDQQISTVMEPLQEIGSVAVVDYAGDYFHPAEIAREIAYEVFRKVVHGYEIVLFGTSLGGVLIPDVLGLLLLKPYRQNITVVLSDSPAGMGTFFPVRQVGDWAVVPAEKLLYNFTPSPRANSGYGKWILEKMRGMPKDENILPPYDGITDGQFQEFRAHIKELANQYQDGHNFTMWWTQLRYMASVDPKTWAANLTGVKRVVYIASTGANETVMPEAFDIWSAHVPGIFRQEVETAHAAYLEGAPLWVAELRRIFRLIGLI